MRSDLALAALASAAVPGIKPVAVAALVLEDDSDHQQAVVEDATGRRWLVRSPLSPVAGARLQRNDELVRQLSRHVPFKVPAPVGFAAVGQDGHAVVYPHVEGAPLDFTHLPAGRGLASAVGRAVAAVHNIPRGLFEEQDVPLFDAAGCRQRLIAEVDRAAETGRVPTGLLARWEEAFDAAPLWQFATTPVHGSFRGASVLVAFSDEDAASGRVVAVTDWEDAMVADPAVDLAELYSQASPAAWESVLDAYALARAQRPDPYLHARARLVAETRRLRGLAHAVGAGDEQSTRRTVETLRRMDRLTEAEDSLVPAAARGAGAVAGTTAGPHREAAAADVEDGAVPPQGAPDSQAPDGDPGQPVPEEPRAPGPSVAQDRSVADPEDVADLDEDAVDPDEDVVDPDEDVADPDEDVTTEVPVAAARAVSPGADTSTDGGNQTPVRDDGAAQASAPHSAPSDTHLEEVQAEEETSQLPDAEDARDPEPGADSGFHEDVEATVETVDMDTPGTAATGATEPRAVSETTGATENTGETSAPHPGESDADGLEDLDDEDRLHELYGMPTAEAEQDR